jgi:hypothetical protein
MLGEAFLVVALEEIAALVGEHVRLDDQQVFYLGFDDFHGVLFQRDETFALTLIAGLTRNLLNERQILRFRRWRMFLRHEGQKKGKKTNEE